jgi:hypothetical protein
VAEYRTVAELRLQQRHKVVLWSDFEAFSTTPSIFNVAGDRLGHVPYTPEALEALAEFFVQQIDALPTTVLKSRSSESGNATLHDFLGSLGVELTVSPATPPDEDAATALVRHTTHFINIPDRKWTAGDFVACTTDSSEGASWIFRVRDRFGDYGVSGAAVLNFEAGTMRLPLWFLTCPVLGKQVEYALMNWMVNLAQSHGATSIEVPFVKGRDNPVQYTFLSQMEGGIAIDGNSIPEEHIFSLAVAGLKERVAQLAPNPSAVAEISSRMHINGIDMRVSA